jgi:hypothetical protein
VRIFVVVAKNRPDLYEYFTASFQGVEMITVILDRRLGADNAAAGETRGASERRIPRDVYDELESRGFVIVRLSA